MILITGVTGHLGKAVLESLLNKISPTDIAVLVRNKSKVAELKSKGIIVQMGDYDDYTSLVNAFIGIDKLYFVSGSDLHKRLSQHENVVNAAKKAEVKQVIYTSLQLKNETNMSPIALLAKAHFTTEKLLRESGLDYSILRHGCYAEMIPRLIGEKGFETGKIFLPAGNGRSSFVTRKDLAEAGAVILTTPGHDNRIYELTGVESIDFTEVAKILSSIAGRRFEYLSPEPKAFTRTLRNAGVPDETIQYLLGFGKAISEGEFDHLTRDLEKLLGKKPTTVRQFLKIFYNQNCL